MRSAEAQRRSDLKGVGGQRFQPGRRQRQNATRPNSASPQVAGEGIGREFEIATRHGILHCFHDQVVFLKPISPFPDTHYFKASSLRQLLVLKPDSSRAVLAGRARQSPIVGGIVRRVEPEAVEKSMIV